MLDSSYNYGAKGELASKTNAAGTTQYTYDVLCNLTRVVLPTQTIDSIVDGFGHGVGNKIDGTLALGLLWTSNEHGNLPVPVPSRSFDRRDQ